MHFFVLMALLPFCMTVFICLHSVLHSHQPKVPPWTYQVTLTVMLSGLLASGAIIEQSWLWSLLYLLATGISLTFGIKKFHQSYRHLWIALMLTPLTTLWLANIWVVGQSLFLQADMAHLIEANVARWNQTANLDIELPTRIQPQDIRVFRSWSPQKRVGLLNEKQQIEFVVDIKARQIVDVIRVKYLTSGDLWVWPSISS